MSQFQRTEIGGTGNPKEGGAEVSIDVVRRAERLDAESNVDIAMANPTYRAVAATALNELEVKREDLALAA
jgi:hypothetical protein